MQKLRPEKTEILAAVHREIASAQTFLHKAFSDNAPFAPKTVNRLVSIGVPIYNRHVETQQLIAVLCWQISQLDEHILVDIHDNGKNESNVLFIEKVVEIFPFVRYRSSFCNVGADLNIASLYMVSETPFRWILGDDDLPAPGALEHVADIVARHASTNVTLFHIGNVIADLELNDIIDDDPGPSHHYEAGIHYLDKDHAVVNIGREFLRMSVNIMKVLPLREVVERHLVGSGISPLCFNLNALTYGRCCFSNLPLLVYREGEKSHWISKWPRIAHYNFPRLFGAMALSGLLSAEAVDKLFNARPNFVFGENADRRAAFNHENWHRMLPASDLDGAEASLSKIDLTNGVMREWANGRPADIDCLSHWRAFRPECVGEPAPDSFAIDERLIYVMIPADCSGGSAGFRFFDIPAFGDVVCELHAWVRDDGQPPVVNTLGMRPSAEGGPFRQIAAVVPTPGRPVQYKVQMGHIGGPIDLEIRFTLDGKSQIGATALCVVKRLLVSMSPAQGSA